MNQSFCVITTLCLLSGHAQIVHLLLERNKSGTIPSDSQGATPLHYAAQSNFAVSKAWQLPPFTLECRRQHAQFHLPHVPKAPLRSTLSTRTAGIPHLPLCFLSGPTASIVIVLFPGTPENLFYLPPAVLVNLYLLLAPKILEKY